MPMPKSPSSVHSTISAMVRARASHPSHRDSRSAHGTAIQDDVRELSRGDVRLWPATLYGSLEELVAKGWLEEVAEDERREGISGRERFYRITRAGRLALKPEASRLD